MKKLVQKKQKAVALRKKGFSYSEILQQVPVAKSTLSSWLKDTPLTKEEKQVLKARTDNNISRGRIKAASELRKRRLEREKIWLVEAKKIFEKYKDEPLFHAGVAMYWAEGAKTDTRWMIINTDVDVIEMMLLWLDKYPKVHSSNICFRLFIHKVYDDARFEEWWQAKLELSPDQFLKTIYKKTQNKTKVKSGHKGCIRIEVKNSKWLMFTMKVLNNFAIDYYRKQ